MKTNTTETFQVQVIGKSGDPVWFEDCGFEFQIKGVLERVKEVAPKGAEIRINKVETTVKETIINIIFK